MDGNQTLGGKRRSLTGGKDPKGFRGWKNIRAQKGGREDSSAQLCSKMRRWGGKDTVGGLRERNPQSVGNTQM